MLFYTALCLALMPPLILLYCLVRKLLFTSKQSCAAPNKLILVIGSDTGFGYSSSIHLQRCGFTVLAGCLSLSSEGAQKLSQIPGIHPLHTDVTNRESLIRARSIIEHFISKHSGPDKKADMCLWAVYCVAGVLTMGECQWITEQQLTRTYDVNVLGLYRSAVTFLPLLRASGGRLVLVGSVCGWLTTPYITAYSSSKAAVYTLAQALRIELRGTGVDIVCTVPGDFVLQSNLIVNQIREMDKMWEAMDEAERFECEDRFHRLRQRFDNIENIVQSVCVINTPRIVRCMTNPAMDLRPYRCYTGLGTLEYLYVLIYRYLPASVIDYLQSRNLSHKLLIYDWPSIDLNRLNLIG